MSALVRLLYGYIFFCQIESASTYFCFSSCYNGGMALDNISIQIIVDEMKEELVGTVLGKPLALGGYDFAIPYGTLMNENDHRHGSLIFSMEPNMPYLTFSHDRFEKVEMNTPFFNSLKKLTMSTILDIKKEKGERVVTISLKTNPNDLSEINTGFDFVLELFPNHPNCYIIAYPYGMIVSLFKEKTDIEKGVFVARNTKYSYPPERNPFPEHLESFEELRPYLSNGLYRLVQEYKDKNPLSPDQIAELLRKSHTLYIKGKEIYPFDFGMSEMNPIKPDEIYRYLVDDQKKKAKLEKEKELLSLIEHSQKVNEKKIQNLKQDLANARKHLCYMEYGQIIYLYQGEISKGDTLLERDGYSIPLQPNLDGPNNANRYFKLYRKAKSAITILTELIENAEAEKHYLKMKRNEAMNGTPRDIMELKSELLETGYIKERQTRKGQIRKVNKRKTYEPHYLCYGNGKIGFGMNGLQNEELTFNIAKKENLFLHVKDYPGSHVVILSGGENPEVIRLGCELALYLSHMDSGEVMIAEKKHVKKNPAKIGLVSVLKYQTLMIKYIRKESLELIKKALKA